MTVTARQKKLRSQRTASALLQLQTHFPAAFPSDDAAIVPLAISLREELHAWVNQHPELNRANILCAMQHHCSRETYQRTVIAGTMRLHLNGEPSEPVTPEGQARAEQRLVQIKADRIAAEQRIAAQKSSPAVKKAPKPKAKPKAPPPKPATPPPPPAKPQPTVVIKKRRTFTLPG